MLGLGNSLIFNNRVKRGGAIVPFNTIAPVVSGTNSVGSLLTTTNGTWSGSLPITYTYQWLRNGLNISGATSSTYTLVTADSSNVVSCKVTATNTVGSANATSNSLTIYESEYKSILNYATTNGYTLPSDAVKLKQNQLLINLKAAGIWSKLDTFALFATDGNSQFALIDWKRLLQYENVSGSAFTTKEGFTGNGSSAYIDTKFIPTTNGINYTLNNASRYFYVFSGSTTNSALDGTNTTINNSQFSNSAAQRINSSNSLVGVPINSFSFATGTPTKSIHRTSLTNVTLFNGIVSGTRTQTSTELPSTNQYILRNAATYGASKISMYAMGASLVSENTAFVNAINTYMTGL
jgi:hypothetical protein